MAENNRADSTPAKKKILVIEDNFDYLILTQHAFSKMGAEVTAAEDGEIAIELYRQEPFDLVLLDYRLPNYDGAEVARRIRVIDPSAKIAIVTSYDLPMVKAKFTELEISGFFQKPVTEADCIKLLSY